MTTLTDPTALATNRQGDITPEQRKALVSAMQRFGWLGCVLTVVLIVGVVKVAGDWLGQHEVIGGAVVIGILIFSFLLVGQLTAIPARRRVDNARVEKISGEVIWRGANYVPIADGHTLRSIDKSGQTLAPGHYTFYRMENSDWLLSAEMVQGNASVSSPIHDTIGGFGNSQSVVGVPEGNLTVNELRRALEATREYHADALDANRDGRMTGGQRAALVRDSLLTAIFAVFAFGVALFMGIAGTQGGKDPGSTLLVAGIFVIIGVVCLLAIYRDMADALGGRVEMVSGKGGRHIQHSHTGRTSTTTYLYDISTMRFSVSRAGYNALVEGVVYRAYYAPRTKRLLNFEPDEGSVKSKV